jgi:broad specificity phosphatase PhoE
VERVVFVRHAEPLVVEHMPPAGWPLTEKGRRDARRLGARLEGRSATPTVWSSPQLRARETAALAFPRVPAGVRDQLREVKKPWYASADEHAAAVAAYWRGEVVAGWEGRAEVIARLPALTSGVEQTETLVVVSHGVLLTTWLDHEFGLDDPASFWARLRLPDAWELNLRAQTLQRVV